MDTSTQIFSIKSLKESDRVQGRVRSPVSTMRVLRVSWAAPSQGHELDTKLVQAGEGFLTSCPTEAAPLQAEILAAMAPNSMLLPHQVAETPVPAPGWCVYCKTQWTQTEAMHAQRLPKSLHTFTVQAETGNGTTEKESCFTIPFDLWVYRSPSANGDRRWNSRWKVMQEQSLNSGYGNVSSEAKRKAEEQKRSLLLFLRFMDCMKMRWTRQGLAGAILSVSPSEVLLLVACSTSPGVQNSNSDKL